MSSKLSSFTLPGTIHSSLYKNPPGDLPSIEELERLEQELKAARRAAAERRRKANDDLRTIEDSMRRMTEREKGKFKAIEKVKRERDYTPMLDGDDSRLSASYPGSSSKSRHGSHPVNAIPSSSRPSQDPRRLTAEELKKKKKKRKREGGDSDVEPELQRPHKVSPPAPPPPASLPKPPKPHAPQPTAKPLNTPDWTVPPSVQLLPPRPPIPAPPIPGPSKPIEVMEDFSKAKLPTQVQINTFYSSVEPYIRNIKEEDIGFLEYTGDEVEPFVMPKLGRHYLEVWEDQDAGLLPPLHGQQDAPPSAFAAPAPKWDPSTLSDGDLNGEEKGHGPLTERVICALLPTEDAASWRGVKAAEDAMEGRPGGSGAAAARRERLNVTDLEARIRDTMRYHGLIDTVPDFTERVDDPIASALREAQRELRKVVATNKARKARLTAIAKDRLGYQEYLEWRDSIDRNITNLYSKLQKKDQPKSSKKKKKPLQGAAAAAAAAHAAKEGNGGDDALPVLAPCPAALGLTPDEDNRLTVNDQLRHLTETRRAWVDGVGSVFEMKEAENPGRLYGLPKESIYQGVEEEVQAALAALPVPPSNSAALTRGVQPPPAPGAVSAAASGSAMMNGAPRFLANGSHKGKEVVRGDAVDVS